MAARLSFYFYLSALLECAKTLEIMIKYALTTFSFRFTGIFQAY